MVESQEAIQAFKSAAIRIYGGRLADVILFGSHARGEAREGSDIDVLLVLEGKVDPYEELERLSEAIYEIELEHDVLFGIVPASVDEYQEGATPLLRNVRRDGIAA